MSTARFPIPQGTLDMLILQILSLEPGHGYGIAQRLQQVSRDAVQVNQGSLLSGAPSPRTARLVGRGVASSRKPAGRPSSTRSTKAGRKQLAVERATWNRLADAVQLIFNEGD